MRKYSVISTGLYLEGRPIFSQYQYLCESNTIGDKVVVNCTGKADQNYEIIQRADDATVDCFAPYQVTKSF